ncbi:type I restriction enzyme, S subunit [Lachnospiraceae bacterium KHCPX20]|nr:type I restriction enzyme, S subunit [Lachnospiraceae bacterium KHCPX20]
MANTPKIRFEGFTDNWEQRKVGELCERITRKNKNGESDLPLTIASQYGLIDQRDFFNKVVAAKDMSNYYLLKKGEFAYNKSYSNGFDYGSIKRLNAYEQGCLSTLYICFGITSDDIESDYLECFFDTLKWYSDITMICAEGARNHGLLNVDTKAFFDEVTIEMPTSKDEQKKISAYLNNLDNLITLHQRKCDETKELKKYMLQKMFPKKGEKVPEIRFAGFTDDWEQRKFGELLNETREKTTVEDEDTLLSCAIDGMFLNSELFSHFRGSSNIGYLKVKKNDLILSAQNLHLGNCNVNLRFEHGIISPAYKVYELINCNPLFMQAWIKQDKTKDFFLKASTEGASVCRKNIVWEELYKQELPVPKIDEQEKIGKFFHELDNLITLHQRKCDETKTVKKYMLQNMFPGKDD